jgi:hypothetical protein
MGEGSGIGVGVGVVEGEGEAREKVMERAREKVMEEVRERVMEKAMKRRVAVVLGASQPTLALGRQTSNCHAGQDQCRRFTSDFSWLLSLGKAGWLLAFSGRPLSEHWTGS